MKKYNVNEYRVEIKRSELKGKTDAEIRAIVIDRAIFEEARKSEIFETMEEANKAIKYNNSACYVRDAVPFFDISLQLIEVVTEDEDGECLTVDFEYDAEKAINQEILETIKECYAVK